MLGNQTTKRIKKWVWRLTCDKRKKKSMDDFPVNFNCLISFYLVNEKKKKIPTTGEIQLKNSKNKPQVNMKV